MEMIMKKETKETTPKDRIVVLEKGKDMEIGPLAICCAAFLFPYRGW
jgi:hypothetical protein